MSADVKAAGDLVTLEDQDRSVWDAAEISEGVSLLEGALRRGRPGPYQIQAAIAACHAVAVGMARGPLAGLELVEALGLPERQWTVQGADLSRVSVASP